MGTQERFFGRWLLPVYPMLCLLAAWAAVAAATALAGRVRPAWRGAVWLAAVAGLLLCAQGLVYSVHIDLVLTRDDTRALARQWLVANVPAGDRVVVEPIAPEPVGAGPRAARPTPPAPATAGTSGRRRASRAGR